MNWRVQAGVGLVALVLIAVPGCGTEGASDLSAESETRDQASADRAQEPQEWDVAPDEEDTAGEDLEQAERLIKEWRTRFIAGDCAWLEKNTLVVTRVGEGYDNVYDSPPVSMSRFRAACEAGTLTSPNDHRHVVGAQPPIEIVFDRVTDGEDVYQNVQEILDYSRAPENGHPDGEEYFGDYLNLYHGNYTVPSRDNEASSSTNVIKTSKGFLVAFSGGFTS